MRPVLGGRDRGRVMIRPPGRTWCFHATWYLRYTTHMDAAALNDVIQKTLTVRRI